VPVAEQASFSYYGGRGLPPVPLTSDPPKTEFQLAHFTGVGARAAAKSGNWLEIGLGIASGEQYVGNVGGGG